jgi:hypothetical protein
MFFKTLCLSQQTFENYKRHGKGMNENGQNWFQKNKLFSIFFGNPEI